MKKNLNEETRRIRQMMTKIHEQLSDEPSYTDSNTEFSNHELRDLIESMIYDLRFYNRDLAANIITAKLEEKYPQLKVNNMEK